MTSLVALSPVEVNETLRGDYDQPRCPVCGRFARRGSDGSWVFACLTWLHGDQYAHDQASTTATLSA